MSLETDADAFHARNIFDPDSLYARMRARYDPELKRRGQFYSWEAIRMEAKVRPILAAAAASHGSAKSDDKGPLVVAMFADEPERDVPVELHGRFSRTSAARRWSSARSSCTRDSRPSIESIAQTSG